MNTSLVGKYKTITDISLRLGISAGTIPKGAVVHIEQVDVQYGKVLFRSGSDVDWIPDTILHKLEKI